MENFRAMLDTESAKLVEIAVAQVPVAPTDINMTKSSGSVADVDRETLLLPKKIRDLSAFPEVKNFSEPNDCYCASL